MQKQKQISVDGLTDPSLCFVLKLGSTWEGFSYEGGLDTEHGGLRGGGREGSLQSSVAFIGC